MLVDGNYDYPTHRRVSWYHSAWVVSMIRNRTHNTERTSRRGALAKLATAGALLAGSGVATAQPGNSDNDRYDEDGNGYPDEGEVVTGVYRAEYWYDADGDVWGYNLSNQEQTTGDKSALDPATTTKCYYKIQYRGSFENDPYQDTGWIKNVINCKGDNPARYNWIFVHESDPRYDGTGTPIWGTWEYHVDVQGGVGNLEAPRPANDD